MIIKHRNVGNEDFVLLIRYLSSGVEQNRLQLGDLEPHSFYAKADEDEMVTLVHEGTAYETGYNPFARLLTAKPSYSGEDDLMWAIEVEIPDNFHVGVIYKADFDRLARIKRGSDEGDSPGPVVISSRFAAEISDILKGVARKKMNTQPSVNSEQKPHTEKLPDMNR